jgi:integrase
VGIYYNKRRKRWIAQVQFEGLRDSQSCATKAEARTAAAAILQALQKQAKADAEAADRPVTLRLICAAYALDLERRGKAPDSVVRAKDTVKRFEEYLGKRFDEPLKKSILEDLYGFRQYRLANRIKTSTINRDLRTLRAVFKRTLPELRFPGDLFFKEDDTRVRWLDPVQELDVMSRLKPPFAEIARLAALTLMRINEILTLRREQVSLSQGVLRLPQTKTGPGIVVLSRDALDILRRQLESHSKAWVFPNPQGRPYSRVYVGRQWREAAQAAGLVDFHFHDLRHHGATMALNAGFSTAIVMDLGRWKTEKMMRRYAAVTDKTLRAAAEAVAGNVRAEKAVEKNGRANAECKQEDKPAYSDSPTASSQSCRQGD